MASIEDQINNARTMEDIVNLLSILFTNLNNQNEQYYDMFLNPVPMDLDLERYDENGELVTIVHPNVAKMRITAYSGPGNPNGVQAASIGALYIDTVTRDLYYKAVGSDSYGWQLMWTVANLVADVDYLTPTGNGSQLTDLNMDNARSGTLSVARGGTGVNSITGLIKGNGTGPFTAAVAGEDYLSPTSIEGCIMYWPSKILPSRSLICDGALYNISARPELTRLCSILGNTYGGDGVTTFKVPNLINRYIKGGVIANVGKTGNAHIGAHTHTGKTSNNTQTHKHNRGNMEITGQFAQEIGEDRKVAKDYTKGAFHWGSGSVPGTSSSPGGDVDEILYFNASKAWTGETSVETARHNHAVTIDSAGSGTNDVDHIIMVPIIKY